MSVSTVFPSPSPCPPTPCTIPRAFVLPCPPPHGQHLVIREPLALGLGTAYSTYRTVYSILFVQCWEWRTASGMPGKGYPESHLQLQFYSSCVATCGQWLRGWALSPGPRHPCGFSPRPRGFPARVAPSQLGAGSWPGLSTFATCGP